MANQYKFDYQWLNLEVKRLETPCKRNSVRHRQKKHTGVNMVATVKDEEGVFSLRTAGQYGLQGAGRMVPDGQSEEFHRVLSGIEHDQPAHVQYHVCGPL